jgi:hypothetical protein
VPFGGQPIMLGQNYPRMTTQPYVQNQPRQGQQPARAQAPIIKVPPVIRAQAPDTPSLAMPAPESFGIRLGQNEEAPLDWNQLRQQLDKLGANSFQLEKQGSGFRFTCRLPSGSLEGLGASEGEAVRVALAKVAK